MFKGPFCRGADEQPLPAIPGYGTHDHDGGIYITAKLWQFFVGQPCDKVCIGGIDIVLFDNFSKPFFMVCNDLLFKFFKRY